MNNCTKAKGNVTKSTSFHAAKILINGKGFMYGCSELIELTVNVPVRAKKPSENGVTNSQDSH